MKLLRGELDQAPKMEVNVGHKFKLENFRPTVAKKSELHIFYIFSQQINMSSINIFHRGFSPVVHRRERERERERETETERESSIHVQYVFCCFAGESKSIKYQFIFFSDTCRQSFNFNSTQFYFFVMYMIITHLFDCVNTI